MVLKPDAKRGCPVVQHLGALEVTAPLRHDAEAVERVGLRALCARGTRHLDAALIESRRFVRFAAVASRRPLPPQRVGEQRVQRRLVEESDCLIEELIGQFALSVRLGGAGLLANAASLRYPIVRRVA